METCTHAGNYNNYLEGCMNEQAAGTGCSGCRAVYPCGGISCVQSAFARRRCPMQQQQPNVTSQLTLITRRLRAAHPVEGGGGGVGGAEGDQLIARLLCAAVQRCIVSLSFYFSASPSLLASFKVVLKFPKKFTSLRAPGCTCARLHVSMTLATSNMTTLLHARVHSSSGSLVVVVVVLRCFNLLPIVGSWSLN